MKLTMIKVLFLCLTVSLVLMACGGDNENSMGSTSQEDRSAESVEKKTEMTPDEIGQRVSALYVESMSQLVELLENKPEPSEVQAQVKTLQEKTIAKMVELGHKREALDSAGRSKVDSQIRMKMNSFYDDPVFTSFNDIQQHYFQNQDFHEIIMSFNIITQYANFDLLKKQKPEEAERLGIQ